MNEATGIEWGRLRVLLAEDEKFALGIEKLVLKQLGIGLVTVAMDGGEALKLLDGAADFDLVISDWNMPFITGIELLRILRQKRSDVPFIMVTGNTAVAQVKEALGQGVDAYLVKPFSPDQMKQKIISVLGKRLKT
ncbi:MAG: response regulator [Alphaproteobacteria bacterium]|nr:response regulator [Alphaproteobacteria bacterium]